MPRFSRQTYKRVYQKFHASLKECFLTNLDTSPKILAAISGGADSVVLLHLLLKWGKKHHWQVVVGHVNHQLRGKASLRDQKFVERLAQKWGVPFQVRHCQVKKYAQQKKISLENAARVLRYQALAEIAQQTGCTWIATGHQASDQTETYFMHFLRGSGPQGLAGMPLSQNLGQIVPLEQKRFVLLIRPLLTVNKSEITQYVRYHRLKFRSDQTNKDEYFLRNWIRRRAVPLLKTRQPRLEQITHNHIRLQQMIADFTRLELLKMRQSVIPAEQQASFLAERGKSLLVGSGSPNQLQSLDKPFYLELSVFFRYHNHLRCSFLHFVWPHLSFHEIALEEQYLYRALRAGTERIVIDPRKKPLRGPISLNEKGSLGSPSLGRERIVFPGQHSLKRWPWQVKGRILKRLPRNWRSKVKRPASHSAYFDFDRLGGDKAVFEVRSWRKGDRLVPLGMAGHKKLQDLWADAKIPQIERQKIPLVVCQGRIVWVVGVRQEAHSAISRGTQKKIEIVFTRQDGTSVS